MNVHLFSGSFASHEEAVAYTQRQWPDNSESEAPSWLLKEDLDAHLDEDFIETIFGDEWHDYLESVLADQEQVALVWGLAQTDNTLVLIYEPAVGGFETDLGSTPVLQFLGTYATNMR